MKTVLFFTIAFLSVAYGKPGVASCIYGPRWQMLSSQEREAALAHPGTSIEKKECLHRYLDRIVESGADLSTAFSFTRDNATNDSLVDISALAKLASLDTTGNAGDWQALLELWEKRHGALTIHISRLQQDGNVLRADSLMKVGVLSGTIRAFDYLRWAQIKQVLGEYNTAAKLLCKASTGENRLGIIAQSQLLRMLEEADSVDAYSVLQAFERCALSGQIADTLVLRNWLADAYNRFGLHEETRRVLSTLESSANSSRDELFRIAQMHFSRKQYDEALQTALLAYNRLDSKRWQAACAALVYQCYHQKGQIDSAVVWLEKTGLSDLKQIKDAVVLYQMAGNFEKASSLIEKVPVSRSRDTLMFRQHLFASNAPQAISEASEMLSANRWQGHAGTLRLWLVRSSLFSGEFKRTMALLDSFSLDPGWHAAQEILRYRYGFQRLRSSPAALEKWAETEYLIYVGRLQAATALVSQEVLPEKPSQFLLSRVIERLLAADRYGLIRETLLAMPETRIAPEHHYYLGESLLRAGEFEQGRSVLENLIVKHPQDVFSIKARLLLNL